MIRFWQLNIKIDKQSESRSSCKSVQGLENINIFGASFSQLLVHQIICNRNGCKIPPPQRNSENLTKIRSIWVWETIIAKKYQDYGHFLYSKDILSI